MNIHSHHPSHPPVGRHPDRPAHPRARPSEEPSDNRAGGFSTILRRYPVVLGVTVLAGALLLTAACGIVWSTSDPTARIPYASAAALLLTALCGGITAGKLNPSSPLWAGGLCGCLSAVPLILTGLILGGSGLLPWVLRLSVIPLHLLGSALTRPRKGGNTHRGGKHPARR
jgi:hypothetical protein